MRRVTSSTAVDGLVRLCTTSEHRRFLQALGLTIGIKSWAEDFRTVLSESNRQGPPAKDVAGSRNMNKLISTSPLADVRFSVPCFCIYICTLIARLSIPVYG